MENKVSYRCVICGRAATRRYVCTSPDVDVPVCTSCLFLILDPSRDIKRKIIQKYGVAPKIKYREEMP